MSPAYIYVMANPLRHLQGQISSKAHIGSSAPDELLRAGAPEKPLRLPRLELRAPESQIVHNISSYT